MGHGVVSTEVCASAPAAVHAMAVLTQHHTDVTDVIDQVQPAACSTGSIDLPPPPPPTPLLHACAHWHIC